MFHAKKMLLYVTVGSVLISAEVSARAADAEGKAAGYLTKVGAIWVNGTSGRALIAPPWDPHRLHNFRLRYVSSSAHVWWYRVPHRQIYFALDHSGHSWCDAIVWLYWLDADGHGAWKYYLAHVTKIGEDSSASATDSEMNGEAAPTTPQPKDALPEPGMSEPDDGGGSDALPPPSDFRLFPDDNAPGTGSDDSGTSPDDFFQPPPSTTPPDGSTTPPADDTNPPFSSDLFPPRSP